MRMFITSKNKYLSNDMKIFGTCSIPLKQTTVKPNIWMLIMLKVHTLFTWVNGGDIYLNCYKKCGTYPIFVIIKGEVPHPPLSTIVKKYSMK